jgi:hypothetical protein
MTKDTYIMIHGLTSMIQILAGLIVGAVIGLGFGMIQDAARRRNERKQAEGKGVTSGWTLIPGSGVRVAFLLITLVIIQVFCPLLFKDGTQWWVSGGLILGYGYVLYQQLRQRVAKNK